MERGWLIDSSTPYMLCSRQATVHVYSAVRFGSVLGKVYGLVSVDAVYEAVLVVGESECPKLHRELCRQLLRN